MSTKIQDGLIFNLYTPCQIRYNQSFDGYSKVSQVLSRRDELSPLYKYSRCLFVEQLNNYFTNDTNTYYILIVADNDTVEYPYPDSSLPYSIDSLKYIKLIDESIELGNNILNINSSRTLKVKGILLSPGETVEIPIWYHYEDGEHVVTEYRQCFMLECGGIPYFSKTV